MHAYVHGYTDKDGLDYLAHGSDFWIWPKNHSCVKRGDKPFHVSVPASRVSLDEDGSMYVQPFREASKQGATNDQNAALRLENKLLHERIADLERERNKLIHGIRKLLETIDNELGEGAH